MTDLSMVAFMSSGFVISVGMMYKSYRVVKDDIRQDKISDQLINDMRHRQFEDEIVDPEIEEMRLTLKDLEFSYGYRSKSKVA